MTGFRLSESVPPLRTWEIHVWLVPADIADRECGRLRDLLSAEEKARLDRFRFSGDRFRFAAGRGALRVLLGRYAGLDPADVSFALLPHGKPIAAPGTPAEPFSFSVAHSGGRVLIAVSPGIPVGVDIERIREDVEAEALVRRFFAAEEIEEFLSLPAARRLEAFFSAWTRKEAFLKAEGRGLSREPDTLAVSLRPGDPARLLRAPNGVDASAWSLADLDAGPGYRAALAAMHPGPERRCFLFRGLGGTAGLC